MDSTQLQLGTEDKVHVDIVDSFGNRVFRLEVGTRFFARQEAKKDIAVDDLAQHKGNGKPRHPKHLTNAEAWEVLDLVRMSTKKGALLTTPVRVGLAEKFGVSKQTIVNIHTEVQHHIASGRKV